MHVTLNLLVLRCRSIEECRAFYEKLGFVFERAKPGAGPEHFASDTHGFVLELYPSPKNAAENVRLGFAVSAFGPLAELLLCDSDVKVHKAPFKRRGRMHLVVADPDGRRVEICTAL